MRNSGMRVGAGDLDLAGADAIQRPIEVLGVEIGGPDVDVALVSLAVPGARQAGVGVRHRSPQRSETRERGGEHDNCDHDPAAAAGDVRAHKGAWLPIPDQEPPEVD
jgi:hypothetical protein